MKFRVSSIFLPALLTPVLMRAQASPACVVTAVPAVVRAEGVAEKVGDIVLSCTGPSGSEINGNLAVILSTTVTNRITSSGSLDVSLTINGSLANAAPTLGGNHQVLFTGLRIAFDASGAAVLRISNMRVDASQGGSALTDQPAGSPSLPIQPVRAQLAFSPGGLLALSASQVTVGVPERGLFATTVTTVIPSHAGSPVPDPPTFSGAFGAGTFFGSTRVTEGSFDAFDRSGTRILLRFSNYPAEARLFVPAGIAGSNAQIPTRAGDFGGSVSGGQYVPGSGTLFLTRVLGTDANGAAGYLASVTPPALEALTEVPLAGGSGMAVFEVVDSSPQARESAQIPVFLAIPRSELARSGRGSLTVSFGPLSTTPTASTFAPAPRFVGVNAPVDCTVLGDCSTYIPKMEAPPVNLDFRLIRGVGNQLRDIPLSNVGGGRLMPWSATIEYKQGSDWIVLDRTSALEPVLVRVMVRALPNMAPGVYEATLTIDAGLAGVARYPIRLEVIEAPPPAENPNRPRVSSVVHGATFQSGPVARGSLVTLRGSNLGGANVSVTFDGRPASILYTSSDQINLRVPDDLPGNTAQVVVTANGVASAPVSVEVAGANPGIFTPGILNQDGSVNSETNPAPTGSYVQIFATGLLAPDGSGVVEATLHGYPFAPLPYAGPAPGFPGVQQVNLQIPEGWPTMTTTVLVCTSAGGSRQCSAPVYIHLRNAQ